MQNALYYFQTYLNTFWWDIIEKEFLKFIFLATISLPDHISFAHTYCMPGRQKREGREGRGGWSVNEERKKKRERREGWPRVTQKRRRNNKATQDFPPENSFAPKAINNIIRLWGKSMCGRKGTISLP